MLAMGLSLPTTPIVSVVTTDRRGQTPEELAKRCVERIVSVSDTAPPAIRDQAVAFRAAVEKVVLQYMREAVTNDRVTVYNALVEAGQPTLAEAIQKL